MPHSKSDPFSPAYYGRAVLLLRINFSSPMPPRYAHPRLIAWLRRPIRRSQCSCYLCSQLGLRSLSITRGQPQITLERLRCLLGRYYFFLFGKTPPCCWKRSKQSAVWKFKLSQSVTAFLLAAPAAAEAAARLYNSGYHL